jgi:hypothetical protein
VAPSNREGRKSSHDRSLQRHPSFDGGADSLIAHDCPIQDTPRVDHVDVSGRVPKAPVYDPDPRRDVETSLQREHRPQDLRRSVGENLTTSKPDDGPA